MSVPSPNPNDFRAIRPLCERLNTGAAAPDLHHPCRQHYVRHCQDNGLAPHVRRLGRKILVSESGFLAWLDSKGART